MPPEATDILKPMSQARSSGQSIEMRRSADYLGFLGRSRSVQNPLPAVAPKATDGVADVQSQSHEPAPSWRPVALAPEVLLGKNARSAVAASKL
jgi:hypothetical protein